MKKIAVITLVALMMLSAGCSNVSRRQQVLNPEMAEQPSQPQVTQGIYDYSQHTTIAPEQIEVTFRREMPQIYVSQLSWQDASGTLVTAGSSQGVVLSPDGLSLIAGEVAHLRLNEPVELNARELLINALAGTKSFRLVEHSVGETAIAGLAGQKTGLNEVLQDKYDVAQVMLGTVIRQPQGHYTLALRAFDLKSGQVVGAVTTEGQDLSAVIYLAAADMAVAVAAKGWRCRVVAVEDDGIYVNAGLKDGLAANDIYLLKRCGKAITDPETGEILGYREEQLGYLVIEKVMDDRLSRAHVRGTESNDEPPEVFVGDFAVAAPYPAPKVQTETRKWKEVYGQ